MCKIGKFALAVMAVIFCMAESRAQDVLNSRIPSFSAKPGREFEALCYNANILCAEERAADKKATKVTEAMSFGSSTVREALDAIVARYPEYRWTLEAGVVTLLPVEGAGMGANGSLVSTFPMPAGKIAGDLVQICKLVGHSCRAVGEEYPYDKFDFEKIPRSTCTVTVGAGDTLGQVLNAVTSQTKKKFWRIRPIGYEGYQIDFLFWLVQDSSVRAAVERARSGKVVDGLERNREYYRAENKRREEQRARERRESNIQAEKFKAEVAVRMKARMEANSIVRACEHEAEAIQRNPPVMWKDFDKLADKYKKKSLEAERFARRKAISYAPLEERERRAKELLAEASDPKAFDRTTVLYMLGTLWDTDFKRGNYDKAMADYRAGMKRYGFEGGGYEIEIQRKERQIAVKKTEGPMTEAVMAMIKAYFAEEKEGNEDYIFKKYFVSNFSAKSYESYLEEFYGSREKEFKGAELTFGSETIGSAVITVGVIARNGKPITIHIRLELRKEDGQWKFSR